MMSTRRTQDKQWTEPPGVKSDADEEVSPAAIVSNHPQPLYRTGFRVVYSFGESPFPRSTVL